MRTLNLNRPSSQTGSVTQYTEHIGHYLKFSLQILLVLLLSMTLMSVALANDPNQLPKNIIILIGDGIGEHHVQAAGLFRFGDQYRSNDETRFVWEKFPFLKGDVYPKAIFAGAASSNFVFPDSAPTATTIATGVITANGRISTDATGTVELETLLEFYKVRGRATGLVTTSRMTHATPAAFGAHDEDRSHEGDIAFDYLERSRPNLLLGGKVRGIEDLPTITNEDIIVDGGWSIA